jgi:predicted  nucleic acid-binding Zn-ribbon protein
MLASLTSLIALQSTDTAADASRRRLAELPKAEQDVDARIAAATRAVDAAKAKVQESSTARRALEKDVAAVDARLARFDDHKAAVKTNQEYTALLHEIATAKTEKDSLEERILVLMEEADALSALVKSAEETLAQAKRDGAAARAAFAAERAALEAEVKGLEDLRAQQRTGVDKQTLTTYDQLLKGRRGLAVARMEGEMCGACRMRLRPHVTQAIRRNEGIVQCESCQRILYFEPPVQGGVAPATS